MKTAFEGTGDILDVDLLAAFVQAWRQAASGALRFSRGPSSAGFDLVEGEIVGVSSTEPRFETAAILVRAGKLDGAAHERLAVSPGADTALASLQAGLLTRREWKWGEKIRAIEVMADLLSWPDGRYAFDPLARRERGDFVLTIPRLLLELFLRSRDRHLVEHQLGSLDVPLVRSEGFEEEFASFGLTADAESVVRLIDGSATAAEISQRAPAEEFAVLKLLAALKTLGLLRAEERAEEPVADLGDEPAPLAADTALPEFESWSAAEMGLAPEASARAASLDESTPEFEVASDEPFAQAPTDLQASEAESSESVPIESVETSLRHEPERELEEPRWQDVPPVASWETPEPLDREIEPSVPALAPPERPRRRQGSLILGLLAFLAFAVAATVLLRSRSVSREGTAEPTPALIRSAPAAPAPSAPPLPTSAPSLPSAAPVATALPRATAPAPARSGKPVSAPPRLEKQAPARESGGTGAGRAPWDERARRAEARLRKEPKTRYAVQLELACEVPSLAEAWRHDQPAGLLWLLPSPHRGKPCFKVLWGRFATLEEARRAKPKIPAYFVTATNHPAVVSVR